MKKYILISLFLINSISVISQNKKLSSVKVDDNLTRYYINYENGLPTLTTNKYGSLKFYLEKYVKISDDKKNISYNLIFDLNEKIINSLNKDIYVTIVFLDYSIINARPSLENEGAFKGNITIPIKNIDRLTKTAIKSINFKIKGESDENDIVFKFNKDDAGNLKFQKEALLIKEGK
ncbi:hypothetical protein MCETHM1_01125 [Flavobacteriaceae bacterium]|jgi:hypothetical protein